MQQLWKREFWFVWKQGQYGLHTFCDHFLLWRGIYFSTQLAISRFFKAHTLTYINNMKQFLNIEISRHFFRFSNYQIFSNESTTTGIIANEHIQQKPNQTQIYHFFLVNKLTISNFYQYNGPFYHNCKYAMNKN